MDDVLSVVDMLRDTLPAREDDKKDEGAGAAAIPPSTTTSTNNLHALSSSASPLQYLKQEVQNKSGVFKIKM